MIAQVRLTACRLKRYLYGERGLVEAWQVPFERALVVLRYALAVLVLLAVPVGGRIWFLLACDVAFGNTILVWLLPRDMLLTRWLAMIWDWHATMILLWAAAPTLSAAPSLLIVLITLAALRGPRRSCACSRAQASGPSGPAARPISGCAA